MHKKTIALVMALFLGVVYCADAWACGKGAVYGDNADGTVTDCRTGLIWLQNVACTDPSGGVDPDQSAMVTWEDSSRWAAGLVEGICGLKKVRSQGRWRLPTEAELLGLLQDIGAPDQGKRGGSVGAGLSHAFINVHPGNYWTSSAVGGVAPLVWSVSPNDGISYLSERTFRHYTWPIFDTEVGDKD